jgi:hypothetical protein
MRAARKRDPEHYAAIDKASHARRDGLVTRIVTEKTCNKCGQLKPASAFGPDPRVRDGLRGWCKQCHVDHATQWNKDHPDRFRLNQRRMVVKKRYGITLEDYAALLASQGGRCAVCGTSDPGKQTWHIDHCHKTGVVRGVLCGRCNRSIGAFEDDPELLAKAVAYLTRSVAT